MAKKKPATDESDVYVQSAVNLLKRDWKLLRRVADAYADKHRGRRSVSATLSRLIEANRKALEKEASEQ